MKNSGKNILLGITLCVLGIGFGSTGIYSAPLGQVTFVKGKAQYLEGRTWKKVTLGTEIQPGMKIQTAYKSYLIVVMTNNTQLQIRENSAIEFGKDTTEKLTSVQMSHGVVASYVQKNETEKNRYKIRTPTATAGVRGTFMTTSQYGSESKVEVLSGEGYVAPLESSADDDI